MKLLVLVDGKSGITYNSCEAIWDRLILLEVEDGNGNHNECGGVDLSDISHRVLARRNNIYQSLVRKLDIKGVESSQLYNRLDYLPMRCKGVIRGRVPTAKAFKGKRG